MCGNTAIDQIAISQGNRFQTAYIADKRSIAHIVHTLNMRIENRYVIDLNGSISALRCFKQCIGKIQQIN